MTERDRIHALTVDLLEATTPILHNQPISRVIDAVCALTFSTIASACENAEERARVLHRFARAVDRVADRE